MSNLSHYIAISLTLRRAKEKQRLNFKVFQIHVYICLALTLIDSSHPKLQIVKPCQNSEITVFKPLFSFSSFFGCFGEFVGSGDCFIVRCSFLPTNTYFNISVLSFLCVRIHTDLLSAGAQYPKTPIGLFPANLCQGHHRGTLETWTVKAFGRLTCLKCFSWKCNNFQGLHEFPMEQLTCFLSKSVSRASRYSPISLLVQACCEKIPQRWPGRRGRHRASEEGAKGSCGRSAYEQKGLWLFLPPSGTVSTSQYLPWPLFFVFPCWDGFRGSLICPVRLWGMWERCQS